jgi:hypothetical protein
MDVNRIKPSIAVLPPENMDISVPKLFLSVDN